MSYPFVAAPDNWSRGDTPVRAIVIHMAEGGGTVSWLTHDDGNSSHYVVEYSGRIVQMVREDRAAGSINPTELRRTDDPAYTFEGERVVYGYSAAKKVLGSYWSNPNAAVIAIETEGFATDGPNVKQRAALKALVADIRTRYPVPTLGHRDFQSYKRCPGKFIPWPDYGGHAVDPEDSMALVKYTAPVTEVGGTITTIAAAQAIPLSGEVGERLPLAAGITRPAIGVFTLDDLADRPAYLMLVGSRLAFVVQSAVTFTPDDGPNTGGATEGELDAAYRSGIQDGIEGEQLRIRNLLGV
jgi:N-acetylmuramoyl-L-alanine amidase-like protein